MSRKEPNTEKELCLVCDLDGTLVKNDFFAERFLRSLVFKPLTTLKYLSKGLVVLKHHLLDTYIPNISAVLNKDVVELIEKNKSRYNRIVLISASTDSFVKRVAKEVGIFDECYGTETINLKGKQKLDFIHAQNLTPFVYIGDAKADNIIFAAAEYYYVIKNNKPVLVK